MEKKTISDYTDAEFLYFVRKICNADYETEAEHTKAVLEFERLTEHPHRNGLIYHPMYDQDDSPEGIVKEVREWRAKNGKPGFKQG
ncbi:bacteriocin immunity protein [Erwinia sp. ErVv1]|uniref:bacteriocin immunity protein n=1 Tax=Erwinia sp. ErVv1 TaxID=1603299 RepID=UPI00082D787B|nr:bacteriocin immunity protein [Erwinia sp. ErVv1]